MITVSIFSFNGVSSSSPSILKRNFIFKSPLRSGLPENNSFLLSKVSPVSSKFLISNEIIPT
jgi:hypothetical protein